MVVLTPRRTAQLETAVLNGSLENVKNLLRNVKKVPKNIVQAAKNVFSEARRSGESNEQLTRRQEIENALKEKQGIVKRFTTLFGFDGGKHKRKRKTKKLKIPPLVAEEAVEVLAEVAVGGKRRKTRKNK